jgi:hypothetical protein
MEPLGVAVVIPVLNEAASIAGVISEIPHDVAPEIIVVDGGSSDGTAEIAAAAGLGSLSRANKVTVGLVSPAARGHRSIAGSSCSWTATAPTATI